jgi:hypothetical protein
VLVVASFGAQAAGDAHNCALIGNMFSAAAGWRDANMDPQTALDASSYMKELPVEQRKKIINMVYFDPGLQYAGGNALMMQVVQLCLNDWKTFQPLK